VQKAGFSLIELLIALAIIGVIAAITYPQYTTHVVKVRRDLAAVTLTELAGKLEQYYVVNNKYSGATIEQLGIDSSLAKFYQFNLQVSENDFLLRANPIGSQAKEDIVCGSLILNQLGEKNISGSGDREWCWR
jgi:type IV pilus assembly protein PilE